MRIMAIDYGDARTGIAVSDSTGTLTGYTTVIQSWKPDVVVERITTLAREREVSELVLGHPVNMNGTLGPRAEKAEELAGQLRKATLLPVILWDERRTTVDAHQILFQNGKNGKKRKNLVDAVAASLILEGYLIWKAGHPDSIPAPPKCTGTESTEADRTGADSRAAVGAAEHAETEKKGAPA